MLNKGWLDVADLTNPDFYAPNFKPEPVAAEEGSDPAGDGEDAAIQYRLRDGTYCWYTKPTLTISSMLDRDLDFCEWALKNCPITEVYQRGGAIVGLSTINGKTHDGSATTYDAISYYDKFSLHNALSRAANFRKWDARKKAFTSCYPPDIFPSRLLERFDKDYSVIRAIITTPTLATVRTSTGLIDIIIEAPGYNKATGLYYNPGGIDFGVIPERPTKDAAIAALAELCEPIAQFPFVDEASKSVQLVRMLTGAVRATLPTSPLTAYTAPTSRTGKSKLVDIAYVISHGRLVPVIAISSDVNELDKQLQALLSCGATVAALDNQNTDRPLESDLLSQMLTQTEVEVRPFGQNEKMMRYPTVATISVTGNNLSVAKDLTERTLLCSLDAKMETPGSRKFDFDPAAMALERRVRLVRACLIILRAYAVAGYPKQAFDPMGGFEDWSNRVRSALVWLDCADPCATMDRIRASDPGRGLHHTIMELWERVLGPGGFSAADAVRAVTKGQGDGDQGASELLDAFWSTTARDTKNLPPALGRWLSGKDGVVIEGRRFVSVGRKSHSKYRLSVINPSRGVFDA